MSSHADQVRELLEQAGRLPPSATTLQLLQMAAGIADTHNDVELGLEARRPLMWVARNLMRGDILTTAFTWCLAQYERDPERCEAGDLLWEQSMVIGQLANLPDVSRATLEALLEHFRRRLEANGSSLRRLHETRYQIAPDLGDRTMALTAREALRRPRPIPFEYIDNPYDEITAVVFLGEDDRALHIADLLLKGGLHGGQADMSAADLLIPLMRHGRADDARRLLKRAMRGYHPQQVYYWPHGGVIMAQALLGDLKRAVKAYQECQRAVTPQSDPLTRLHFALDATVLFDRLIDVGRREIKLRLPDWLPVGHADRGYSVEALRAWLRQEATQLADRFDARNGSDHFRGLLQARSELQRFALPIPEK